MVSSWIQSNNGSQFTGSNTRTGKTVAVTGDGNTFVYSSSFGTDGDLLVYEYANGSWSQKGTTITTNNDSTAIKGGLLGYEKIDISDDANVVIGQIRSTDFTGLEVFEWDGTDYTSAITFKADPNYEGNSGNYGINFDLSDKVETSNDLLARIFRMPKSYVTGLAATVLIALLVVGNNFTFDQTNNEIIANAASSREAQDHLNNIDGALNQHVMKILAADNLNVDYLNTNLVPVGYNQDPSKPSYFSNGNNKFRLHIENNNFGLKTDRYWNVNNELVYVHPMRNGRLATIYGKIEPQEAKSFLAYIDR